MTLLRLLLLLVLSFCANIDAIISTRTAFNVLDNYIGEVLDSAGNGTECAKQLKIYVADIKKSQIWAAQMLDSTAKLPPGLLNGNMFLIGNYDECLQISVQRNGSQIKGQYCKTTVVPGESLNQCVNKKFHENNIVKFGKTSVSEVLNLISVSWDVCIPAACTANDLQKLWDFAEKRHELKLHLKFEKKLCSTIEEGNQYTLLDVTAITLFGVLGVVILLSTIYDVLVFQKCKDKECNLYMAFSFYTNGKRLFSTKNTKISHLSCLNGIRVITMVWIILGHHIMFSVIGIANYAYVLEWLKHEENMFILGTFASVNSFFVMSGFLLIYIVFTARENEMDINLLVFYFHRILRLAPSVAATILIYLGLIMHLGSGPFWNYIDLIFKEPCETNWWSTLTFVQNYVHPQQLCVVHAWYLAVDTQLYVLSPLLFLPLQRWPRITVAFVLALIIASIASAVYAVYEYELDSITIQNAFTYTEHLYLPTHARMGPWLVGILLGHYMFMYKNQKIILKKIYVVLLWITTLLLMLLIVYLHSWFVNSKFTILMAAIFTATSHTIWGACICWIIFACSFGFGGYINKFLSLTVFRIFARLTFSMYILHPLVLIVVQAQKRTVSNFDNLEHFHGFWGDFAFTVGLSILWTLTFESPVTILENVLIKKRAVNYRW